MAIRLLINKLQSLGFPYCRLRHFCGRWCWIARSAGGAWTSWAQPGQPSDVARQNMGILPADKHQILRKMWNDDFNCQRMVIDVDFEWEAMKFGG